MPRQGRLAGRRWYRWLVRAPDGRAGTEPSAPPRVTYLVKRLELAIRAELDAIVGDFGVTALQYTALSVLARHPGMSGAQLARRSFVSAQAGSEMVAVLERKGLIRRSPHEANRRVLRIGLTGEGSALLAACDAAVDRLEQRMLEGVSVTRRDGLRADLMACIGALSSMEEPGDGLAAAATDHTEGARPRSR